MERAGRDLARGISGEAGTAAPVARQPTSRVRTYATGCACHAGLAAVVAAARTDGGDACRAGYRDLGEGAPQAAGLKATRREGDHAAFRRPVRGRRRRRELPPLRLPGRAGAGECGLLTCTACG